MFRMILSWVALMLTPPSPAARLAYNLDRLNILNHKTWACRKPYRSLVMALVT